MINVIATDLDGTLLDDHHQFDTTLFTRVLRALHKSGGQLIIATGEQLDWCEQRFASWKGQLAFVAANGAVVADQNGQVIASHQFSKTNLEVVEKVLASQHINQFVIGPLRGGLVMQQAPATFKKIMAFYYPHLQTVTSWQAVTQPVVKVAVAVHEGQERQIAMQLNQSLGSDLKAVVGGNGELDILLANVDKGLGVQELLKKAGGSSQNLLAFGDQLNDLPLFNLAGESCAVANAVPEVKEVATRVVASNNQGGVLKELKRRFVNLPKPD